MASLSSQSLQIYRRHLRELAQFTQSMHQGWEFLPCQPDVLVLHIQDLFQSGMAAASIRSRVAAIGFWHKTCRLPDPSRDWLVKRALMGVSKIRPQKDARHPITVANLLALVQAAASFPDLHTAVMLRALFAMMFFAFLRISEVTQGPHNICIHQVKFCKSQVKVSFTSFKSSLGRTPVVCVFKQKGQMCPHKLLWQYRALRGDRQGPFFVTSKGEPLPSSLVNACLAICVAQAGLNHLHITSHSFRIGAASWAVAHGHSVEQVKAMGRWRSDAVNKYVRIASIRVGDNP